MFFVGVVLLLVEVVLGVVGLAALEVEVTAGSPAASMQYDLFMRKLSQDLAIDGFLVDLSALRHRSTGVRKGFL